MARIRSIKPDLRTSLTAAQWPREVRYFWVLLWGYLDDHGYGADVPVVIKADCFPLDDDLTADDIDKWLDLIASTVVAPGEPAPLCRYEVAGRRYLHAFKWALHQRPQHPAAPKFPPCPRASHETVMTSHETLTPSTAGLNENGILPGQRVSGESPETLTPEGVVKQVVEQVEVAVTRETRPRAASTLLGNSLLDEHRRLCNPPPPRDVARRVGEHINSLLDDPEIKHEEIREGLRRLRSNRKWGAGMLPTLVDEVRRENAGTGTPPSRSQAATDQIFEDAAARIAARKEVTT